MAGAHALTSIANMESFPQHIKSSSHFSVLPPPIWVFFRPSVTLHEIILSVGFDLHSIGLVRWPSAKEQLITFWLCSSSMISNVTGSCVFHL